MKEGQRFRPGYRYTTDGFEHRGECQCKNCSDFETFLEKRCPGLLQKRSIKGETVRVATR
jgi:hypothetical protein